MGETTICLKEYLSAEDCSKINELKNICIDKENIFLKLELEFKLNLSNMYKCQPFKYTNEFLYYYGETLIGYLGIFSMGGETGELTGMVHPQYRRIGVFNKLYSLAKAECLRRNLKKILLVCDNRSVTGLEFIKHTGAFYSFSEYEMKLEDNHVSERGNIIALRKAINSDAEEIARQNFVYFGDTGRTVIMPEDEEKRNRITYMIQLGSRIIGRIKVETSGDEGFISGFGILPEFRSQGYGKQALKTALYILNENNIHKAALEVAAENENALKLYKSYGFSQESVTDYYEGK